MAAARAIIAAPREIQMIGSLDVLAVGFGAGGRVVVVVVVVVVVGGAGMRYPPFTFF